MINDEKSNNINFETDNISNVVQSKKKNEISNNSDQENKKENDNLDNYPKSTEWEISSPCFFYFCCCCRHSFNRCSCLNEFISPCITVKDKSHKRTFWGFLELDLCGPIFALFLITISHLSFFFTVLTFVKTTEKKTFYFFMIFMMFFLLFMFLWSFFGSACSDPGFLPFDWESHQNFTSHHQHQNNFFFNVPKVGWRSQLSGLAIHQDQIEYAKKHCPSFASFSRSAGRFVIRADHICGWTGNWVGKRNHKQFILMTFWGSLMVFNLFFWQFKYARMKVVEEDGSNRFRFLFSLGPIGFFVQLCALLFEPIFFVLLFAEFVQSLINIIRNTTKIKNWKMSQQKNDGTKSNIEYGCLKSMKEICGNSSIFCWIFPFFAFGNDLIMTDEEMIVESPDILY